MNYDESVRALMALGRELAAPQQARVQKFGLENISILAEALGNPQRAAPCVHIAGTNGKGSTAAMLESILRAAGLRTGLYTSPHLERINERIRINGEDISDDGFRGRMDARAEPRSKRCWPPASSRRIRHSSSASRRWPSSRLPKHERRFRDLRSGHGRAPRRDQHRRAGSRRDHADRFRPREFSRAFHRRDCRRKGGNHQARSVGGELAPKGPKRAR